VEGGGGAWGREELGVWSFVWGLSGLWSVVQRREWGPARELGTRAALIHVYMLVFSFDVHTSNLYSR